MRAAGPAPPPRLSRRLTPRLAAAILAVICAVAVARVTATYRVFSATADEAQHVAAGIDWWGNRFDRWRGAFMWHLMGNPPLARAAVGLRPYLAGLRPRKPADVLYNPAGQVETMRAARSAVLPFLVLLIVLTWAVARRLFGAAAGLVAAAAVSTLPPVLGHAGLATTDVAAAATYMLAFLTLARWFDSPSAGRAALFGLAFGLAFATKTSVLTLVPAAALVLVHRRLASGPPPRAARARAAVAAELALAAAAAVLAVWAAYRFSFGRPDELGDPTTIARLVDHCAGGSAGRSLWRALLHVPMPAPQVADGLLVLCAFDSPGMNATYLLGRITQDGFPLFFPVALLVKSPLPFIALAVWGLRAVLRDREAGPERQRRLVPALVALTILVSVLPSRINIGVRHVLPIYPLMAVYVGPGLVALWRSARPRLGRALAVGLAAWQLAIPFLAAPDYLPWFNALAGRHPEDVLLDSDLDWGQDLFRLEKLLAELGVPRMSIAYFGPSDLCREPLPPGRWLRPYERVTGTVVISEMYLKGVASTSFVDGNYCDRTKLTPESHPDYDQYAWLRAYTPVARVGASILVYEIPPDATAPPAPTSPGR